MRIITDFVKRVNPEIYVFTVSAASLTLLWILNPSNKIIAASFFALIPIFYYKLKNIKISVLLTYLVSSVIFTGKTYPMQIIPPEVLPIEIYPLGYFISYTITPGHILVVLLLFLIIRDILNHKLQKLIFGIQDYLVVLLFTWPIIADMFSSKDLKFSLLYSVTSLSMLLIYFYIRLYAKSSAYWFKLIISVVSGLIIFEALISFQQFTLKSPVGNNLELQHNIEYFGNAPDELMFTFRPLGTFTHANALGMWLGSYLPIVLIILITNPNNISLATLLLGFTSLTMTLSRSAWLGFLISTLTSLFVLEKINHYKIPNIIYKYISKYFILGILITLFFVVPRLEKSINISSGGGLFREVQTKRAIESILANPFFGVGSERSIQEGLKYLTSDKENSSIVQNTHNWYLLNTVEHGIPYMCIFTVLVVLYLRTYVGKVSGPFVKDNIVRTGLAGGIVGTLIAAIFQPYISFNIILLGLIFSNIKNDHHI